MKLYPCMQNYANVIQIDASMGIMNLTGINFNFTAEPV